MSYFPEVNYRYIVQPSKPLKKSWLDLNDRKYMAGLQRLGRIDGEMAVKDGEGYIYSKLQEWQNQKMDIL